MEKVIVTGADGFIGRRLSVALKESGKEVLALAHRITDSVRSQFESNDIPLRPFTFDRLSDIRAEGFDTVYHLAWAGVCSSSKNDSGEQSGNIIYCLKVMEWAKGNGIRRVIIPGSASEVSCGCHTITGHETSSPSDMYSACKAAARIVCQTYARLNRIELIWTLITSVYGPGRNDNNLITYTIKSLLDGEVPSFTRLEQRWDYIYIDDLIKALICIGEKGKSGKVYPVGSGNCALMKEYVLKIRDLINPELPLGIGLLPYKNGGIIDNQILDTSSLAEDTGFIPQTSFEEGIRKTIAHIRNI